MIYATLFLFLAAVNSTIGNLLLKKSNISETYNFLGFSINFFLFGGIMFYAFNVILFSLALKYYPVSIAYPILASLGFIFLMISSTLIFQEPITTNKIIGITLIISGIIFLFRDV